MKITVLDRATVTNGDVDLRFLESYGEVTYFDYPCDEDELIVRVRDTEAIICNKSLITRRVIESAKNLRYIGLFATGYNNVDTEFAASRGITVCNAGSYSTCAVAQHTFALILAIMGNILEYSKYTAEGGWKLSRSFSYFAYPMRELCGKTLGIVGYGSIGREVEKIALAFGMRVIVHTRTPQNDARFVSFEELLGGSDIITVHCPLTESTKRMFDARAFSMCRDGAVLVNTSRGGVVDEIALRDALTSGKLSYAGLDVLVHEPMAEDCVLCGLPNVIITPHVAWAPLETRQRLISIVKENIDAFLRGEPKNKVN